MSHMGYPLFKGLRGSQRFPRLVNDRLSRIMPVVGYAFLGLSLLDVVTLIIPPQFTNALWEFETIGQLVERLMFPLLGFVFVLFPRYGAVPKVEVLLLKVLSWGCALWGLFYLLLLPPIIHNMFRLEAQNLSQIEEQTQQQLQGVITLEQQLSENSTDPQIQALLQQILSQNPDLKTPDQAKTELVDQLNTLKTRTEGQAKTLQQRYRLNLRKNAVKWAIGATLGGLTFLWIWRLSRGVQTLKFSRSSAAAVVDKSA
jgi:hypothetical protein